MYENILDFKSYQIEDEVVGELDSNDLVELEREYVELTHMTSHLDMIGRMVERVCEVEVQIKDPSLTLKEQRILSNSVKRMSSLFMNSTGVEIALESASDEPALEVAKTLKKWWDALMKFLKSIWEKTKAFFKKVFSVEKKIASSSDKYVKDITENTKKIESINAKPELDKAVNALINWSEKMVTLPTFPESLSVNNPDKKTVSLDYTTYNAKFKELLSTYSKNRLMRLMSSDDVDLLTDIVRDVCTLGTNTEEPLTTKQLKDDLTTDPWHLSTHSVKWLFYRDEGSFELIRKKGDGNLSITYTIGEVLNDPESNEWKPLREPVLQLFSGLLANLDKYQTAITKNYNTFVNDENKIVVGNNLVSFGLISKSLNYLIDEQIAISKSNNKTLENLKKITEKIISDND